MRRNAKRLAFVGVLAMLAGLLVAPVPAQAQVNTRDVRVGAGFPVGNNCDPATFRRCRAGEGNRFYTPTLNVAQGDVVNFVFDSFHTATLLPANTDVSSWKEANAAGIGKPWSLVEEDPDDTAIDEGASAEKPSLKANNAAAFPSSFECGAEGAPPCSHDGTAVTNSGIQFGGGASFAVSLDASPGDSVWFVCLVHPEMQKKINVVADPAEVTPQTAIDDFHADRTAADQERAAAIDARLINKRSRHRTASGKVVWDAWAGFDTHHVSLLAMYPRKLRVRRGQTVRWHQTDVFEDHTVTLPFRKGIGVFENFFANQCDPDGDGGAGPDTDPDLEAPPFCSAGPQALELDLPAQGSWEQGDGRFNGDYQNSGIRGANADLDPYDVKFTKLTRRRGVRYFCLIHGPFMSGRVRVVPRR